MLPTSAPRVPDAPSRPTTACRWLGMTWERAHLHVGFALEGETPGRHDQLTERAGLEAPRDYSAEDLELRCALVVTRNHPTR